MLFQDKIWKLVSDLYNGTAAKAINWSETADEESFRTILDKGMVRIERRVAPQIGSREGTGAATGDQLANPQMRIAVDNFEYWLVLFDEKNNEIARYTPENEPRAVTLRNLWELACASARNTEQKIDSLLEELASKNLLSEVGR